MTLTQVTDFSKKLGRGAMPVRSGSSFQPRRTAFSPAGFFLDVGPSKSRLQFRFERHLGPHTGPAGSPSLSRPRHCSLLRLLSVFSVVTAHEGDRMGQVPGPRPGTELVGGSAGRGGQGITAAPAPCAPAHLRPSERPHAGRRPRRENNQHIHESSLFCASA